MNLEHRHRVRVESAQEMDPNPTNRLNTCNMSEYGTFAPDTNHYRTYQCKPLRGPPLWYSWYLVYRLSSDMNRADNASSVPFST